MVTKGIITYIDQNSNTCKVRLPIYETAWSDEKMEFDAIISIVPGVYNGYKEDDVVIVAFEEDHIETPVVIGKLYLGVAKESADPRGAVNCLTSNVSEQASIPADTKLTMEVDQNTINSNQFYSNIQKVASTLNSLNTDVKQMDIDYGNEFRQITNAVNGISSEIIQTNYDITNKINMSDGDSSEFGWKLSSTDWSVFSKAGDTFTPADALKEAHFSFAESSVYNEELKKVEKKNYFYIDGLKTNLVDSEVLRISGYEDTNEFLSKANSDDIAQRATVITVNNDGWKLVNGTEYILLGDGSGNRVDFCIRPVMVVNPNTGLYVNGNGHFNGDGSFTGTITAKDGNIGKFIIGKEHDCKSESTTEKASGIYSKDYVTAFENTPTENGVYVGTDGIKLGHYCEKAKAEGEEDQHSANFSVDRNGNMIAKSLEIDIQHKWETKEGTNTEKLVSIKGNPNDPASSEASIIGFSFSQHKMKNAVYSDETSKEEGRCGIELYDGHKLKYGNLCGRIDSLCLQYDKTNDRESSVWYDSKGIWEEDYDVNRTITTMHKALRWQSALNSLVMQSNTKNRGTYAGNTETHYTWGARCQYLVAKIGESNTISLNPDTRNPSSLRNANFMLFDGTGYLKRSQYDTRTYVSIAPTPTNYSATVDNPIRPTELIVSHNNASEIKVELGEETDEKTRSWQDGDPDGGKSKETKSTSKLYLNINENDLSRYWSDYESKFTTIARCEVVTTVTTSASEDKKTSTITTKTAGTLYVTGFVLSYFLIEEVHPLNLSYSD